MSLTAKNKYRSEYCTYNTQTGLVSEIGYEMRLTSEKEIHRGGMEFTISLSELMVLWDHISQILLRFDAISARWDI